jgi:hypothetical protein
MRRNSHNMRRNIDCEHKRSSGSVVVAGREDVGEERERESERQRETKSMNIWMDTTSLCSFF